MTIVTPLQPRYVTEASRMPESNQPDGGQPSPPPLSNAERQARWRARHQAQQHATTPMPPGKATSARRRSRPQRWQDAVAELLTLQAEYATWLEALPTSLQDSATAETLAALVDLDLDALASTELPRGYGRD